MIYNLSRLNARASMRREVTTNPAPATISALQFAKSIPISVSWCGTILILTRLNESHEGVVQHTEDVAVKQICGKFTPLVSKGQYLFSLTIEKI